MAFHAVLIIEYSFFFVLPDNTGRGMLMAVVAGIFFIITGLSMAGNAAGSVITVKPEIPVMIKGCRFPCRSPMASSTVSL